MIPGLFITLILWLVSSIVLLWQTSVAALKHGIAPALIPFFVAVMIMDAEAAFIYYGAWATDTWIIVRFLWLASFLFFFIVWTQFIINFIKIKK